VESRATNTGCVDTSTTELETVVSPSDAIQLQKCPARNTPETTASSQSRRSRRGIGCPLTSSTAPMKILDSVSRHAATTSAGASVKRTSGPAQLMASTATISTAAGDTGGRGVSASARCGRTVTMPATPRGA
jgi:hypothetical protein